MKVFWKVLGAALAIGLTPYKVEKDEETGERSYQSLLMRITSTPGEGESKRDINIDLSEGTLTSRLLGAVEEEPHLFSDELCVEYTGAPVTEEAAPEAPAEPEEPAASAEPAEPEKPAAPAEPAEPEAAAEDNPAEAPAEENEEEA